MEKALPSVRHEAFFEGVLAGKSLTKAAKDAGFTNPDRDAAPIIVAPQVRQYVRKRLRGRLEVEGAPAAYILLYNTMQDARQDIKLRVDIAKFLYSCAGYTPPKAQDAPPDQEKLPSEMTTEELRQFIEQGENELANRAKPISASQGFDSLM